MPLIDPEDGSAWTRVGDCLIPDALPAVSEASMKLSTYADWGEEFYDCAYAGQDDYGLHGLSLGHKLRNALNEAMDVATSIIEFEAVHHDLPFGCPIEEIRRCCDELQAWATAFSSPCSDMPEEP